MKIFWLCCKNKFLSSVPYLNLLKSRFHHCPNSAIQFLVFTHVTFALTTVAIRHVGAQTNSENESLNRFFA